MPRLFLAAALALAAAGPLAAQTVRDSVRMELSVYTFYNAYVIGNTPRAACGAGVVATWPNVKQDVLGSPDRTYGYRDYGRVATEGMYIPSGYGEAEAPEGYLAHNPQLGGSSDGPGDCNLAGHVAGAQYRMNGGTGPLNASPFRVTDWYATFTLPSGTPIALFEWDHAGLTVDFDASFESGQSRELDATAPGSKRPVASYAWNFGDGDRGTGARPRHTYDEAGDYTVRLVVTDDDGEEAAREEVVTVTEAELTVEVLSATDRVIQGDTITVTARVTNSGSETVYGVRADRLFSTFARAPDDVADPAGQIWSLSVPAVPVAEGEESTVYRASLAPGESMDVERRYVVERAATYRIYGQTSFAPQDVYVDWTGVHPVKGETAAIDSVEVRQPCGERDARCASTLIAYPVVEAEVRGELAFASVEDGGGFTAGLTYDPQIEDASFYAYGADGNSVGCVSGCVELDLTVTADDRPADGAKVRLFVPALAAGSQTVTPRPHGGWLVAPYTQTGGSPQRDNGTYLDVTTNAEGEAHVLYFAPGVTQDTTVTVRAEVEYLTVKDTTQIAFTIRPNRPAPASWTATPAETAYLRVLSSIIRSAAAGNSVGDLCENSVKWLRARSPLIGDGAIDQSTSLRRNTTLYLSNLGVNVLCGYLIAKVTDRFRSASDITPTTMQESYEALANQNVADFFDGLDAPAGEAKKFAQNHLFLYLLYHLDLGGQMLGLALPSPEPPPVYASFQGDFFDTALEHVVEAFADAPPESSVQIEILLDELSALNAGASYNGYDALLGSTMTFTPSAGTARTYRDRLRVQYQPAIFLDTEADPLTWIQEAVVAVGGALPAAVGETVISGVDALSEPILGAVVQIGQGDTSEINQVVATSDNGRLAGGSVTATFARPTLYAYPEGTEMRVLARGEGGVPAAPLPVPEFRPRELVRLEWLPGTSVAASYDVEVATDTSFTNVVLSVADTDSLTVHLTADDLTLDALYFWRVRGTNVLGDGPWSAWQPVLVNTQPTADEPDADMPAVLALGAPYPNPARSASVTLRADLPEAGAVRVVVFDALGREVAVAHDGPLGAGRHTLSLDAARLPAGVYVVRMDAPGGARVQRLTVVR